MEYDITVTSRFSGTLLFTKSRRNLCKKQLQLINILLYYQDVLLNNTDMKTVLIELELK